jgi:hypothetical protein
MRWFLVLVAAAAGPGGEPQSPFSKGPPEIVSNLEWALGRPVPAPWQSVLVELQNSGGRDREVSAVLEEELTATRVSRVETVPAGGKRRFHLTLPLGSMGLLTATMQPRLRVLDRQGVQITAQALPAAGGWSPESIAVAFLSASRANEGPLRIPRSVARADVLPVFPSTRTFPDHWTGLAGLHVLALHDAPLSELSPEQARAILDYARRGGTVLLIPGAKREWFSHPVLSALAEIDAPETQTRTELPAVEGVVASTHRPFLYHRIRNGRLDEPIDGHPILREFRCGTGRVLALPFDVALPPLAGSDLLEAIWNRVLATAVAAKTAETPSLFPPAQAVPLLTQLVNPYPSFLLLAGLAGIYLVVVGPLNYLLLRRLRMTILLVVTVPFLSVAFLGVTLAVGYLLKGTSTVVCSLRLFETRSGLPLALETQLVTVFSPSTRAYRVSFPRDRAPLPLDRDGHSELGNRRQGSALQIEEGVDRAFSNLPVGQWQTWPAVVRSSADLGGGVRFTSSDGGFKVVNASSVPLLRGLHVRRTNGKRVGTPFGPVAPGGTAEGRFLPTGRNPAEDLGLDPASLGAAVLEDFRTSGATSSGEDSRAELLLCVLPDEGSRLEIDSRPPSRLHAFSLLVVWKEGP